MTRSRTALTLAEVDAVLLAISNLIEDTDDETAAALETALAKLRAARSQFVRAGR